MSFESCVSSLKDAIIDHCENLVSTHNTDSTAHSNLLSWNSQTIGSYATLYVNEKLRLVIFHYSRSYNYTSTNDVTLETGIIPSDYRPSTSIPCSMALPFVAGRITSAGSLICRPTGTGTLGTTLQAIWVY